MSEKNLSQKDAEHLLYDGGLRIHACVDVEMQRKLEDVFNNFTDYLNGNNGQSSVPFIQWTVDGAVVFMAEGSVQEEGSPEEIFEAPSLKRTRMFFLLKYIKYL